MNNPKLLPPQYPLSREEFRRALASGLGRAKVHVARHGAAEFRDEVLAAATVCGVYDLPSNGARADWLADLVLTAGVEQEVVALPVPEDPDDRNHRAALLKELAARRIQGAHEALHACWGPGLYSDYYAMSEILELDGDAGLLFVARELGKRCLADEDFSVDSSEFWAYDQTRSEDAAAALLAEHSSRDEHIRACVQSIEKRRECASRIATGPQRPSRSIEEVLHALRSAREDQRTIWAPPWGRFATREELGRILDLLLELDSPRPLHHALWCLGMSTMPPLHPRIFELTRHADDEVRFWAARCLSKHSLHAVRVCGFEAIARGDLLVGLEMLTRSTLVDDADAIASALGPLADVDEQHGVCGTLLDILRESVEVVDPRLAFHAYEWTPCMYCREKAVRWLSHHRALPDWMVEESAVDARSDIRALARSDTSFDG